MSPPLNAPLVMYGVNSQPFFLLSFIESLGLSYISKMGYYGYDSFIKKWLTFRRKKALDIANHLALLIPYVLFFVTHYLDKTFWTCSTFETISALSLVMKSKTSIFRLPVLPKIIIVHGTLVWYLYGNSC